MHYSASGRCSSRRWSPDCEAFRPKYTKLGKKVKAVAGLVVATVDVGVNDVPAAYNITTLPALYLARRAGGTGTALEGTGTGSDEQVPIRYQGQLVQNALLQFLRDNTALGIPKAKGKKGKKSKKGKATSSADAQSGGANAGKDEL